MLSSFVGEVFLFSFVWFFASAAIGKLQNFGNFKKNLVSSFAVKESFSGMFAFVIVTAELSIATTMLSSESILGVLAALALFCVFTFVLTYKFYTTSIVKCSCFGESQRAVSGFDLFRNFLVIVLMCVWLGFMRSSNDANLLFHHRVLAGAIATTISFLVINLHDVAILLRGK